MFTRADLEFRSDAVTGSPESTLEEARSVANEALKAFDETLPAHASFEIFLIRGLEEVEVEGERKLSVSVLPQFMFLLDVGFEALVGVSVWWDPLGFGDPAFPDFAKADLVSVLSRDSSDLVYPILAGEILVGLKEGISPDEARRGLEDAGLRDITVLRGSRANPVLLCRCRPFREQSICRELLVTLPLVRDAEPHGIGRPDLKWSVHQLA
jgi:hypothetical protein